MATLAETTVDRAVSAATIPRPTRPPAPETLFHRPIHRARPTAGVTSADRVAVPVAEQGEQQVPVRPQGAQHERGGADEKDRAECVASPRSRHVTRAGARREREMGCHEPGHEREAGAGGDEVDDEGRRHAPEGDDGRSEERPHDPAHAQHPAEQRHRPGSQVGRHLVGQVRLATEVPREVTERHDEDGAGEHPEPPRPGGGECGDETHRVEHRGQVDGQQEPAQQCPQLRVHLASLIS